MLYLFQIQITEKDYYAFNLFHALRSPYGKPSVRMIRILFAIITVVLVGYVLFPFTGELAQIISAVHLLIITSLLQLLVHPIFILILKLNIRQMKKTGKMPYSPESTIEFYDTTFKEITPGQSSEYAYDKLERISVVRGQAIYMHLNNLGAYIIPENCFPTPADTENFIQFLKTKCKTIDTY